MRERVGVRGMEKEEEEEEEEEEEGGGGGIKGGIAIFYEAEMDEIISILQISQRDILNSIDREMSGDLREGFKTVGEQRREKGSTHLHAIMLVTLSLSLLSLSLPPSLSFPLSLSLSLSPLLLPPSLPLSLPQ